MIGEATETETENATTGTGTGIGPTVMTADATIPTGEVSSGCTAEVI